ncbi:MAG TPA: class I SAM-dependent methyltransferase [Waddliaceae bacterium]
MWENTNIKSPITGSSNTQKEAEIFSSIIRKKYTEELDIDVSRFLQATEKIFVYKCLDSGYRFYYPFNITGDDAFYQNLEHFPWYYVDWKWEHGIAEKFVKKNDTVLEIGCARGGFLKKIKTDGANVEGLEMNSDALKSCREDGLSVYSETIEKFAPNKKNFYDIVCSFQVLEHIPDVKNFIESSLFALKPGGLMIISVPNNDSVIFRSGDITLNMPPHHMGLWNMNSLIALQKYFNIHLESIYLEPLRESDIGFTDSLVKRELHTKLSKKLGIFGRLIENMTKRFANLGILAVSEYIVGHTIVVVFRKKYE